MRRALGGVEMRCCSEANCARFANRPINQHKAPGTTVFLVICRPASESKEAALAFIGI